MNEDYQALIYKNLRNLYWDQLGLKDYEKRIEQRTSRVRGKKVASFIKEKGLLKGRILDVGSGWGEMICELYKNASEKVDIFGVEPDKDELLISKMLAEKENIQASLSRGFAEDLKFPDNHFDLIVCFDVIEHVQNYKKSLQEIIRVLKSRGVIYLSAPNYLYPYEGHYKIFYIPLCPKFLVKLYLLVIGRRTEYLNGINYITTYKIFRELRKYNVTIKNLSEEKLEDKKYGNFIKRVIDRLIIRLKIYPVIELLIYKN